jgi:xylan 1,4-beta-xylosidase
LNAFAMLHQLGDQRITLDSDAVLATRRSDGSLAIALWNYAPPFGTGASYTPPPADPGRAKHFTIKLSGVNPNASVKILRLDADHGNVVKAYDAMGRPAFPTRGQIAALRVAGKPSPAESASLRAGSISVSIPSQGLVVLTVEVGR